MLHAFLHYEQQHPIRYFHIQMTLPIPTPNHIWDASL